MVINNKNMKTISIGDIHGVNGWKFITHGSAYDYDSWIESINNGKSIDDEEFSELPYTSSDKIIFVGDYVDSFTLSNIEIKKNLLEIIEFKKLMGDKVVLLLGNHDVQYFINDQICSGYRPEMRFDLEEIYTKNLELFQISYEVRDNEGISYLWTHAGVSNNWLDSLKKFLLDENFKFYGIVKERNPILVSEWLDLAWEIRCDRIFDVDSYSGGSSKNAGPIWIRPRSLNLSPIKGYNQIIGHTPQVSINSIEIEKGIFHHYIDCIEHGDGESLYLEIFQ